VKVVSLTSLWLFFALSAAVRGDRAAGSVQDGATGECGDETHNFYRGHPGRVADLHVELHGMDNASTIATEVERPQRTYPRAMLVAVCIVAASYVLPFAAMWMTGLKPTAWETGSWADIAGLLAVRCCVSGLS